ncbi:hypothetical protein NMG60_11030659 [Bertholletia excelsa]
MARKSISLWKKAVGLIKDQKSLLAATLASRTALRNPDMEVAVIRATSHDECHVDYRNAQRVFAWIRMSPAYLKPFLFSLSTRVDKCRSWVVALKSLILMHGVFCCRSPAVRKIGRLPFDLSDFNAGDRLWGINSLIRDYYTFLDQKSAIMSMEIKIQEGSLMEELAWLQSMQGLLDGLLRIRPERGDGLRVLVLEAMDCVVIEMYDVYSRICSGIAKVLMRIWSMGKEEALIALDILRKAGVQGEELYSYFSYCRNMGVLNAKEFPKVERVKEEDIRELEQIIDGFSDQPDSDCCGTEEEKGIVVREDRKGDLQTKICKEWEVFEDEMMKVNAEILKAGSRKVVPTEDPFPAVAPLAPVPLALPCANHCPELPDLISFA